MGELELDGAITEDLISKLRANGAKPTRIYIDGVGHFETYITGYTINEEQISSRSIGNQLGRCMLPGQKHFKINLTSLRQTKDDLD